MVNILPGVKRKKSPLFQGIIESLNYHFAYYPRKRGYFSIGKP